MIVAIASATFWAVLTATRSASARVASYLDITMRSSPSAATVRIAPSASAAKAPALEYASASSRVRWPTVRERTYAAGPTRTSPAPMQIADSTGATASERAVAPISMPTGMKPW